MIYLSDLDDQTRHYLAYAMVVFLVVLPFAINWLVKRKRPRTTYKFNTDSYGHGNRQRLTRFEKVLARLRII